MLRTSVSTLIFNAIYLNAVVDFNFNLFQKLNKNDENVFILISAADKNGFFSKRKKNVYWNDLRVEFEQFFSKHNEVGPL